MLRDSQAGQTIQGFYYQAFQKPLDPLSTLKGFMAHGT
jgi:hypothetical protein